jgi:hypothetical protein
VIPPAEPRRARHAGAFLGVCAYVLAIVVLSWPLPRFLGSSLVDPIRVGQGPWGRADRDLVEWILAWGAHAVATQPLAIFDANIFYPARGVLASSEHLLGLLPISAPVFLATGNAAATYNVTILLVVLIAAIGTFLLAREWGADDPSAWLAGAVFAFAPLLLQSWLRLHITVVHLLPFVVLLAWRAAASPRRGTLALLALATGLQLLAGVYVTFELGAVLVSVLPVLWWRARRHGHSGLPALGALALAPIAPVYLHLQSIGVLPSGTNPAIEVFRPFLHPAALAGQLQQSVGWPILALAAAGLLCRAGATPASVRVAIGSMAVVGFAFALGPEHPGPYAVAAWLVPGFGGMRTPMRFLVVPLFAVALAAGLGTAALRRLVARGVGPRVARLVAVGACVALVAARRPAGGLPLAAGMSTDQRSIHAWLAEHGDGRPILVLPAFTYALEIPSLAATTEAMVGSTLDWQPLVNGYSGYPPPSDALLMTIAQRLPARDAFDDLCRLVAPGWMLVHERAMPDDWLAQAMRLPVSLATRRGDDVLLRVACPGPPTLLPALRRQLAEGDDGRTLLGLDRRSLAPEARRGEIRPVSPLRPVFAATLPFIGWMEVEHTGRAPWPGLSAWRAGTVALQARWRDATTGAVAFSGPPTSIARDVQPGERIRAQVELMTPQPGTYDLEIGLVRITRSGATEWFADTGGSGLLRRRVETIPLRRRGPKRASLSSRPAGLPARNPVG